MPDLDTSHDIDHRADAITNYTSGTLVCLAGPGTGKTSSFLSRIKVLTERHVPADAICYLTFIKEIVKAFVADYRDEAQTSSLLGDPPRISTLHSFACRLLRNQGFRLGFDGHLYFLSIAEEDDERSVLFTADLLPLVAEGDLRTAPRLRRLLAQIKRAWRNTLDPESLAASIPRVLSRCHDLMKVYRLVDWDYTIPFAATVLGGLEELPAWIARIQHFMVDEYQDFNRAEQALITTLMRQSRSVVIVGDDDQSLYSGRGGSPEGLRQLYRADELDRVTLRRCYRCRSRIVDAANRFLTAMSVTPRQMLPKHEGGQLICYRFKSAKAELVFLARFLRARIQMLPENPRHKDGIVCLFPTRKALGFYLEALKTAGVPCYSRLTPRNAQRKFLEQAMALVTMPEQRFLERLLLENFRAVRNIHKRRMIQVMLERGLSPTHALRELMASGVLSTVARRDAEAFCALCAALSSRNVDQITVGLAGSLGIERSDVQAGVARFLERLDAVEREDALAEICDTLLPGTAAPPEDSRAALFLTMHGAKGLTRKTVVMPGLEDAWLPGSTTGEELEEKKRLFYVALTRATDEVLITFPRTRSRRDPLNYAAPGRGQASRFVTQSGIAEEYHE